jgi:uncharacterized NAD-dependent epimerase/dehydratase family protein
MLRKEQKLVIHFYEQIDKLNGKMGHGILRYSENPIACAIDFNQGGKTTRDLFEFGPDVPVVSNVEQALGYGGEVLVLGMAPSGGRLPESMVTEVEQALAAGLCVVNGLHERISERYANLRAGQWIWDIREEPQGLGIAWARASELTNRRLLLVGSDMAVGKMTAGLEIWKSARAQGIQAEFLATGQIGIAISGRGIPLDAIRVDYAGGAVEKMVLDAADAALAIIEGQGSLLHPGSSSTLPLLRGACPTHLILCHRAGMTELDTVGVTVKVPPLNEVIALYEDVASACGIYPRPVTVGIALNTAHLDDDQAQRAVSETADATGRLVLDPVRQGCDRWVDALMA